MQYNLGQIEVSSVPALNHSVVHYWGPFLVLINRKIVWCNWSAWTTHDTSVCNQKAFARKFLKFHLGFLKWSQTWPSRVGEYLCLLVMDSWSMTLCVTVWQTCNQWKAASQMFDLYRPLMNRRKKIISLDEPTNKIIASQYYFHLSYGSGLFHLCSVNLLVTT